jgi:hypothetical protein
MPSLPQVGALNWGPEVNACLTWLYEQMANNALAINGLVQEVSDMQGAIGLQAGQIESLQAQVTTMAAKPEYIYNSFAWMYSNASPPPTGNQVRFDNANLSLATTATFRLIDVDGADRTNVFQRLSQGSKMRINDWDNAALEHHFSVTGPAIIGGTDATIPLIWTEGNGVLPNAKANVAFLLAWT